MSKWRKYCYRHFGIKIPSGNWNNDETLLGSFYWDNLYSSLCYSITTVQPNILQIYNTSHSEMLQMWTWYHSVRNDNGYFQALFKTFSPFVKCWLRETTITWPSHWKCTCHKLNRTALQQCGFGKVLTSKDTDMWIWQQFLFVKNSHFVFWIELSDMH